MIRRLALGLSASGLLVLPAKAEPCVGAAYDLPFPGAFGVEMQHADVPSSRFPGLWQQGLIDGYAYKIFANNAAVVKENQFLPVWSIVVDCQQTPCIQEVTGSPPDPAKEISRRLEECLVPPDATTPAAMARPKSSAVPEQAADKAGSELDGSLAMEGAVEQVAKEGPVAVASTCKEAAVSEANPIARLQRLLVLAGADPGPIDGAYGRNTRDALLQVLGYAGKNLDVSEAIVAIDAFLCRREQ